jgi:hypothetical protein
MVTTDKQTYKTWSTPASDDELIAQFEELEGESQADTG